MKEHGKLNLVRFDIFEMSKRLRKHVFDPKIKYRNNITIGKFHDKFSVKNAIVIYQDFPRRSWTRMEHLEYSNFEGTLSFSHPSFNVHLVYFCLLTSTIQIVSYSLFVTDYVW